MRLLDPRLVFAPLTLAFLGVLPNASAAQAGVDIKDNFFDPDEVTINLGDSVLWTHVGANAHTTTSDDDLWDSGTLQNGDTFSHAFPNVGTFEYSCTIHNFRGTVFVEDPAGAPDLVFTELKVNNQPFGPLLGVDYAVKNQGTQAAPEVHVRFWYIHGDHSHELLGDDVDALGPNESVDGFRSQQILDHVGSFSLVGLLDSGNAAAESDEANNGGSAPLVLVRAGEGADVKDPNQVVAYARSVVGV